MINRTLSTRAILFASISAILGSGWLFTAFYAAQNAGPAALLAWVIGGVIMVIIAYTFAEQTTMIPVMGASARFPHYTHGSVVGFIFAWIIWLAYMALVPTETQAIIQYIAYFIPTLVHHPSNALTVQGYIAATFLMLIISAINIFSLRWLIRANNGLTIIKIIIPIIIGVALLAQHFSFKHVFHPAGSSFFPLGVHGLLAAISTGGIVFAFNGFKQACEMAGEARRPKVALPIALIGSIVICLVIYLLLQASLLASIKPHGIAFGWKHLSVGASTSPFAAIAGSEHLLWLFPLLYTGAIIGPAAAGLMYMSSASRTLYGASKNGYFPKFLQHVTGQGNPYIAIIVNFLVGLTLFAPLPGWDKMITFLTSLMAVGYAVSPICLLALRQQAPHFRRPFKLPFAKVWCTATLFLCSLLIYWTGWFIISRFIAAMGIGFIFLLCYEFIYRNDDSKSLDWVPSIWLWFYFAGIALISACGNFGGGLHIIPRGWDMLCFAVLSIITMYLAMRFKLPGEKTREYLKALKHQIQNIESTPEDKAEHKVI